MDLDVSATRCTVCRKPLDAASADVVEVAGRVVSRTCPTCSPKVRRGARAARSLALRGVGIAAEKFFPNAFAVAKAAYLGVRDAWDKAQ